MNQKMVDTDINTVMYALCVTHDEAIEMIKNGIDIKYINTRFKSEIEHDTNSLINEHRQKINNILNEEFP